LLADAGAGFIQVLTRLTAHPADSKPQREEINLIQKQQSLRIQKRVTTLHYNEGLSSKSHIFQKKKTCHNKESGSAVIYRFVQTLSPNNFKGGFL
jgi:hypothetical protein